MKNQEPWIVCRNGKQVCLLAKDEKAYYIIEVGKRLDYAVEEWLMQQGISEDLLKELQLSFTFIPKNALRGYAISGCEAGEYVYLYLKSEKKKLILEDDYDPEWMDDFFKGIHSMSTPKKKNPGDNNWRKQYRNPETYDKLKYVAPVFLFCGLVSGLSWMLTRHWLAFTACVGLCAVQLLLVLCFPVYFTIFLPKGAKKQCVWNLDISIWCCGIWLLFGLSEDWLDFHALLWQIPLGIGLGALIYWRVRDLHRKPWGLFSCLLLCCFITMLLAGKANIVYDFTPGESMVLEVEDLHTSSGRRSTSYYCTVILPDGGTEKISISRSLYLELKEGDLVRVEHNIGALGMEYSKVYPIE